jgi:hypothetical protein
VALIVVAAISRRDMPRLPSALVVLVLGTPCRRARTPTGLP